MTYIIYNDKNEVESNEILEKFYGKLWSKCLDRFNHNFSGFIFRIKYKGKTYNIHRVLPDKSD